MKYKLIALDMDGTVLNEKKEITPGVAKAIHEALESGIETVFCTGRSYSEMRDILEEFPDMHYLCGESGALVIDIKEKKNLKVTSFPVETVTKIRDIAKGQDLMPTVFSQGECCVNQKDVTHMADFYMGQYQELYLKVTAKFEDVLDTCVKEKRSAEKINYFCGSKEVREKMYQALLKQKVEATLAYSEITSLECTPPGLDKAAGLRDLCDIMKISMDEVVMVGDADNDLAALNAAGLAIAMGNANENVKAVSDRIVEDNNHDGCAQAIYYAMKG